MRHFWAQNGSFAPKKTLLEKINYISHSSIYWTLLSSKILKKFFQRIQTYVDKQFWGPNGPFAQMRISFRRPIDRPCSFPSCLYTCQKSKSDINLLMKYRRLKNTEISLTKSHFLAIT